MLRMSLVISIMPKLAKKSLCDWSRKDIAKNPDLLTDLVAAPTYVCAKCARSAASKRNLCSPKKLALPSPLTFAPAEPSPARKSA